VYGAPLAPEFFVILVDGAAGRIGCSMHSSRVSQAGAVVNEGGAKNSEARERVPVCGCGCRCGDGGRVHVARRGQRGDHLAPSTDVRVTRQLLWTVHDTVVR
jgi:hypothetical protein